MKVLLQAGTQHKEFENHMTQQPVSYRLPLLTCSWFDLTSSTPLSLPLGVPLGCRSDYEEMPLQNGRAIKATAKYQDESDSD